MLTSLAKITFEDTVLIKMHLLKHPYKCLIGVYLFCTLILGYVVFASERISGHVSKIYDIIWLMVVSITNLGFGDVVPNSVIGRICVGFVSVMGVLMAALWIGAMRELLEIPIAEKRLLAAVRRARQRRIRLDAACRCIQNAWRYYRYKKSFSARSIENSLKCVRKLEKMNKVNDGGAVVDIEGTVRLKIRVKWLNMVEIPRSGKMAKIDLNFENLPEFHVEKPPIHDPNPPITFLEIIEKIT